ncbi:MAG TPA: GTP-binding protein, partial [Myxococcales bacterium]|nr:GTP-binding protein [Myxococcales bacterium]
MEAALREIDEQLLLRAGKELVRLVIIGSVDDGKSTLIGRLLYETGALYDDQIAQVRRATRNGDAVDFSLFTDGLLAEREQGITIDVAYRFFETGRRKFILADTPGHAQYTRNMATGASTADGAIILLDARLGVLPQTRRHAAIAALLGIRRLAVAVNKMDLVGFDEGVFRGLCADLRRFAGPLGFEELRFFPVSARLGDNVATSSARTPWHQGGTILHFLESVGGGREQSHAPFRFPVQLVVRPHLDYRGLAGQIASGSVSVGDEVTVLPSGTRTTVASIDSFEGPLARAAAPMSVVLRLADEVDAARGDLLAHPATAPAPRDRIEATAVWLSERPLDPSRAMLLKHTTRTVPARVAVRSRLDLETLAEAPAAGLALNDIGRIAVTCARPVICDPYAQNRSTGAFILIDALSNETAAAGIIGVAGEAGAVRERPAVLIVEGSDEGSALRRAHEIERFVSASGHLAAVVRHPGAALACAAAGVVAVCPVRPEDGAARAALRDSGAQTLEVGADWARALQAALAI